MAARSGCGALAKIRILVRASKTSIKISLTLLTVVASPLTLVTATRKRITPACEASSVTSFVVKKSFLLIEIGVVLTTEGLPVASNRATVKEVFAPAQLSAATSI